MLTVSNARFQVVFRNNVHEPSRYAYCGKEIRRLKYPEEITPELFEEFAAKSEPLIIEGRAWPCLDLPQQDTLDSCASHLVASGSDP